VPLRVEVVGQEEQEALAAPSAANIRNLGLLANHAPDRRLLLLTLKGRRLTTEEALKGVKQAGSLRADRLQELLVCDPFGKRLEIDRPLLLIALVNARGLPYMLAAPCLLTDPKVAKEPKVKAKRPGLDRDSGVI
jgi:hypothetical protein